MLGFTGMAFHLWSIFEHGPPDQRTTFNRNLLKAISLDDKSFTEEYNSTLRPDDAHPSNR